jgi:hypothetical protein
VVPEAAREAPEAARAVPEAARVVVPETARVEPLPALIGKPTSHPNRSETRQSHREPGHSP